MDNSIVMLMGKKELSHVGQKQVMEKLESNGKMCHAHIFFVTIVHSNASPSGQ
jgi:hypothetical protein